MKKYFSFEDYGRKIGVDRTTVSRQAMAHKLKAIDIMKSKPKLIEEDVEGGPHIISLMNLKGGCGKTTIAVHIAALLSKLNYRVLLIDTDHQNQCRVFFRLSSYQNTLKHALEGTIKFKSAIYTTSTKTSQLDIVYSDYKIALMDIKSMDVMGNLIDPIKSNYDFIVIDTSPNFDMLARSVAKASTDIIIPVAPQPLHIDGMAHNFEGLEDVCKIDVDRVVKGIVFNMVRKTHSQHNYFLDEIKKDFPDLAYDNWIPDQADISKVSHFYTTVFDYKEKSTASQALKKFVWETLTRL